MYEKELSVAIKAAKLAGNAVMKYFNTRDKDFKFKEDETFVTKADVESNVIIIEEIKKHFPSDGIISEELQEIKGGRKWYVDPLDGTESFIRNSDEFGIQIGLCESDKPVLGVVYRVAKGELYYGVKNVGAFKENDQGKIRLKITDKKELEDLVCVTSYGEKAVKKLEELIILLGISKVVRGASTGLRIIKLVDGEADIYILPSSQVKPWDICAPHAILEAAGGKIGYAGGEKVFYPHIDNNKAIVFTRNAEQLTLVVDKIKHTSLCN